MAKTTGGLGGKADSTLVQSSFMLGRSAVPGDWSNIFNKQYEGLIAAHKTRAQAYGFALGTIAKTTGDVLETITEQKGERKETRETKFDEIQEQIDAGINDLVQTHAKKTIGNKKNVQHYQQGGGMPKWNSDAYQNRLEEYKSELEALDNKTFLNKKDREKRTEIYRKLDQLKKNMINEKGIWRTIVDAHANNSINLDLSYKDNKDRQMLLSQYLGYDSNYEDQEIEVWLDDDNNDKKMITYTPGRLGKQYKANNLRNPTLFGEYHIDPVGGTPITISEEELFAGVQYKDVATETALTGLTATSIDNAAEYLDKDSKTYVVTNYDELSINNIAKTKEILGKDDVNLLDLATRDMENIPGQTRVRNFVKELDEYISNTTYEKLGIDINAIEAADTDGDGRISNEEGETLINPKDKKQLIETILGNEDMLKNELANWWDHINRDRFNARRTKLDNITTTAVTTGTDEETTEKVYKNRNIEFDLALGGDDFDLQKTTSDEIINKQNELAGLIQVEIGPGPVKPRYEKGTPETGKFISLFGVKIGYFPGKGYAEIDQSGKEIKPKGEHHKSIRGLFNNYNIPTTYIDMKGTATVSSAAAFNK
jgi:hypothetical protein